MISLATHAETHKHTSFVHLRENQFQLLNSISMLNTYSTVALKYYQRKGNQPKRVRTERKKNRNIFLIPKGLKKIARKLKNLPIVVGVERAFAASSENRREP